MKLNKGKYIKEAQVLTILILNCVFASLIFLTVFQQDTDQIVFWKSYTGKIEAAVQNINTYTGLYDQFQKPELLNSIKQELTILEEYLFYVREGGYIKLKRKDIVIPKINDKAANDQFELLYTIYKQEESELKRSISNFEDNLQTSKYTSEDQFLAQISKFAKTISLENKSLEQSLDNYLVRESLERNFFLIFCLFCLVGLNAFLIFKVHQDIYKNIRFLTQSLGKYINNDKSKVEDFDIDDINNLKIAVTGFIQNVEIASDFAKSIGDGDLEVNSGQLNTSNILGNALLDMQHKLIQVTEEDKKRNWISAGISKIGDILSEQYGKAFNDKVFNYTKAVTDFMLCNQGAVFLLNEDKKYLELFTSYAYQKKKFIEKRLNSDEGLLGQCLLEKEVIYMENVPDSYVNITSGLGYANPRSLLLIPIILEEEIFGVMELASFNKLPEYFITFAKLVSDKLAVAISTHKMNVHTSKLLADSRKVNATLQVKEEQMEKQASEITQQYSILNEKYLKSNEKVKELEKLTFLQDRILELEADINKNVELLNVYKEEVKIQDQQITDYQKNKEELEKRLKKFGDFTEEELSLVERIKKLTENNNALKEKIKELEKDKMLNQSTISSINQAIATAEIDLKGEIISTNDLFLNVFGYSSEELIGRHESILFASNDGSDRINDIKWKKLVKGLTFKTEAHFVKKSKEKMVLKAGYTPVTLPSGRLYKVIMMVQITKAEN